MIEKIENIECDDVRRIPDVIDVTGWRRCRVQMISESGALSKATIEAMITYDPSGHHRESLSVPREIDPSDVGDIFSIDTTNIAFLSFNMKVAESGGRVTLVISLSRPMRGAYTEQIVRCDDVGYVGEIEMQKHQVHIYADAALPNTAAVGVKRSLISVYPDDLPTALTLPINDGYGSVVRDSNDLLPIHVDTAQAGQVLRLHIYGRDEVHDDPAMYAGTSFPPDPYHGQPYLYTGGDRDELFHWDAVRGKWMGDRLQWSFSRSGALSGTFSLRVAGAEYWTSQQGVVGPFQLTFAGYELISKVAFTGNLEAREGSSTLVGSASTGASAKIHYAYDIDIDFTINAAIHKWWRMTVTSGTSDDLVGTVYVHRSYTPPG